MIEEEFVKYIVTNLVDHPDKVSLTSVDDGKGTLLELRVAPDDLGRVIGHGGNTVHAIRSVLRALGMKNNRRYSLKVINTDEENGPAEAVTDAPVEKAAPETVEKSDDELKKLRSDLADLRDSEL